VAHYGCDVGTTEPPHTVEALAEETSLAEFDTLEAVMDMVVDKAP
jgi:hypothetical protein